MKKIKGFSDVQEATESRRLPAGGYVCRIVKVEDVPEKEYLRISFDILDGEYAKWYEGLYKRYEMEWWPATFIRSYKESALRFFKAFIKAVDESNGTDFLEQVESGFDEQKLVRRKIGLVIGYEQYRNKKGEVKERMIVTSNISVDRIQDCDYRVPELKLLAGDTPAFATLDDTDDADLPF